jgi:CubicO group peptidase (beta-lactamase class C family)
LLEGKIVKKVFLLILAVVSIFLFWVIEPFYYNPLHTEEAPFVRSIIKYDCMAESKLQEIADLKLQQYMESNQFLGVNVGFSKGNCGTYIASSGYTDKRHLLKVNDNTINRIASITKPMTAIAIMQLYEKGVIDLDVAIQTYLPNFPVFSKSPITVRHLLSHTSGISHYKSKLDAVSFTKYATLSSAVNTIVERDLSSEPGEKFTYSSFGYTVLGAIIESVSKQSFEEYMSKNIWKKTGMKDTQLEREHSYPNKSRLYVKIGSLYIRSPYNDLSLIYPAGGVQSTAKDLLLFGQAILNNELISKETLEQMTDINNSLSSIAGDDPYGLGWSVYNDSQNGKIIAHSGGQPGASAYLEIYLDKRVVVVALSNAFGTKNSTYSLSKDIGRLIL